MIKLCLFSCFVFLISDFLLAQNQNVGIGTATPHARAQLEITSNNKGILIPRLTTLQRNNIVSPPAGLMIYNNTTQNYNVYDGASWKAMQKELPAGVQVLVDTGQNGGLSELGFSPNGNMYISYRPPSVPVTIPDSTWYSLNQDDPDSLNTPSVTGVFNQGLLFWTGTEALYLRRDSNFKYNPATDKWSGYLNIFNGSIFNALPTLGVWSGTEVILWDGSSNATDINHVYHFNPQTNTFTTFNTAYPYASRSGYSLLWAADKMIIWGGGYQNNGAIYYPGNHLWYPINMPPALQSTIPGRNNHAACWTGTEMIVTGGELLQECSYGFPPTTILARSVIATGFRFNPATFQFNAISTGPFRAGQTTVWTGTDMIAFGGYYLTGGTNCTRSNTASNIGSKYNLASNLWTALPVPASLPPRMNHCALWNGTRMIILGGHMLFKTVNCYDPATNLWTDEIPDCTEFIISNKSIFTGVKIITQTRPQDLNNDFIWFHAFSAVPVTIMQALPRGETRLDVWRKN